MSTEPAEDFDSAKTIFEKLKDVPKERQEKILRWVCESLEIDLPTKYIERPLADQHLPPPADPLPGASGQPVVDIKTFIASKSPKSDQQFAAAVAYYYRFVARPEERKATINAESLQDASRQARGAGLRAPTSTLNNAINAGYLDRAERGTYRINTVGESLVAVTLPGDGAERPRRAKRPTRKRAAKNLPAKKR